MIARLIQILIVASVWMISIVALGKEGGMTSHQADQILKELQQIRQLLEKQQQAPAKPTAAAVRTGTVSIEGKMQQGNPNAALALIEFSDNECPYCQRFHASAYKQLKSKYIDTGQLLFVSVDLPLSFHKNAMHSAHAARCAGEQGQYWQLRDVMINNLRQLSRADIDRYAENLNLDVGALNTCIDSGRHQQAIDSDVADAGKVGITGTPSFVLGRLENGQVTGQIIVGSKPVAHFENLIKQLSRDTAANPPATSIKSSGFRLQHGTVKPGRGS